MCGAAAFFRDDIGVALVFFRDDMCGAFAFFRDDIGVALVFFRDDMCGAFAFFRDDMWELTVVIFLPIFIGMGGMICFFIPYLSFIIYKSQ
jgi:hypothetical protein